MLFNLPSLTRSLALLVLLATVFATAGCGQTGPLKLPEKDKKEEASK